MAPLLVLDLDDTLYAEHTYVRSGFAAVGRWLSEQHGVEGFTELACELFDTGVRGVVFNEALARLGLPVDSCLVRQLVTVYREHRPAIALHLDAAWALEYFAPAFDLGLLTDGYLVTQQRKVEALSIQPLFSAIVYSDEFGREYWKPSRLPYETMMARTGREGRDCIYVSDNPAKDFIGARKAGWRTIRMLRADGIYRDVKIEPGYEPEVTINSFFELPGVLTAGR